MREGPRDLNDGIDKAAEEPDDDGDGASGSEAQIDVVSLGRVVDPTDPEWQDGRHIDDQMDTGRR